MKKVTCMLIPLLRKQCTKLAVFFFFKFNFTAKQMSHKLPAGTVAAFLTLTDEKMRKKMGM